MELDTPIQLYCQQFSLVEVFSTIGCPTPQQQKMCGGQAFFSCVEGRVRVSSVSADGSSSQIPPQEASSE
jgi:hypothetical protein